MWLWKRNFEGNGHTSSERKTWGDEVSMPLLQVQGQQPWQPKDSQASNARWPNIQMWWVRIYCKHSTDRGMAQEDKTCYKCIINRSLQFWLFLALVLFKSISYYQIHFADLSWPIRCCCTWASLSDNAMLWLDLGQMKIQLCGGILRVSIITYSNTTMLDKWGARYNSSGNKYDCDTFETKPSAAR